MKIRCLIGRERDLWVAMSLDFGLAAQAYSRNEAIAKLSEQIEEYINEAITVDRAFQAQLLKRKGPASWFAMYYWEKLKALFKHNGNATFFSKNTSDYISHA